MHDIARVLKTLLGFRLEVRGFEERNGFNTEDTEKERRGHREEKAPGWAGALGDFMNANAAT
jgi:hypothetical protein